MKRYEEWRQKTNDPELKAELEAIAGDSVEIENRFFAELEFGTGGLRGQIGAGTYYMNRYTLIKANKGIANYMVRHGLKSAVIGYDSRNKSDFFARLSAAVLAQNGITVYIFPSLIPTPVVSYAIRKLGADMGAMITASHNPKQYNGYKAYGADGCQIANETADEIYAEICRTPIFDETKEGDFDALERAGLIKTVPDEVYTSYLQTVASQVIRPARGTPLKVLYTPLSGTGNKPVRDALKLTGIENVRVVASQELPDPTFATCPYPNPEFKEAYAEAFKEAEDYEPDIIIATDPDADRIGISVRDKKGNYVLMSGNEVGLLLMDYILKNKPHNKNSVVIKTIVSTALCYRVADKYGVQMADVLTGFKYIGDYINTLEAEGREKDFMFAFEESYGYLVGTHCRDKDAVVAAVLIAEMAAAALAEERTLIDVMMQLYADYGYVQNKLLNIAFPGAKGKADMNALITRLRNSEIAEIGGFKIARRTDFLNDDTGLPKSNVLRYTLVSGEVIVRPSGTEPKMKIYLTAISDHPEKSAEIIAKLEAGVGVLIKG